MTAALGKLEIEKKDLKPKDIMEDWLNYIQQLCATDPEICRNVRKKGKSLKGCIGALLKWSFANMQPIDNDIKKAAGITQNVKLGIPGIRTAHQIIKDYYGRA